MRAPPQIDPKNDKNAIVVRVALRVALDFGFEYTAPPELNLAVGDVVRVPLRGKSVRGVVIEIDVAPKTAPAKLKSLEAREDTPLTSDQLTLCNFVAQYYHAPIGMAFALALPPEPVAERKSTKNALFVPTPQLEKPLISLNSAQNTAFEAISGTFGEHAVHCLHGITGSGKTEVYVAAIRKLLTRGAQALVLVPEINLTPQWLQRLAAQLPEARCVALHSALSAGERYRAWSAAASGQADIVFGTRMAVFAPLPNLGLIVVDEEHDASLKQQETPRYHARDLAVLRGRERGVPVVLGSATPSLETFANVERGRYRALSLPQRGVPTAQPPAVRLVPARDGKKTAGLAPFLLQALDDRIAKGEQSLVFLNRRGFSPLLHCHQCDWRGQCTQCDAPLVFHAFDQKLRCHHCGETQSVPAECPSCGNVELMPQGAGTQKIEAYLRRRYENARIARADADTTRGKHDWAQIYARMSAGEIDILVGTQMIAKGHDFPRLTLVGVLGADDVLYSADFRAPERLFAQLTQVAGRAGRAQLPGEVLVQTDMPDHPVFRALMFESYSEFARRELAERTQAALPPAAALALVRVEAQDIRDAQGVLTRLSRALQRHAGLTVYPPVPSPLARRANRHRWQMMVCAGTRGELQAALSGLAIPSATAMMQVSIDVDPLDLG